MAQLIQLSFEPAYDAYHTIFRVNRLLPLAKASPIEHDKLRIMDFYLCFPALIDQLRLKSEDRRFRRLAQSQRPSYAGRPEGRLAFNRMQPTQAAAVQTLALSGHLSSRALELGWVEASGKEIPADLARRIDSLNREESELIEFLGRLATDYPLSGVNGLKHRSALMEYRYDAV